MKLYRLWLKTESGWQMACSVQANDKDAALSQSLLLIKPDQARLEKMICEDPHRPPDCNN